MRQKCVERKIKKQKIPPAELVAKRIDEKSNGKISMKISSYKKCSVHADMKCNDCGYEWKATPSALLYEPHCPNCSWLKLRIERMTPYEEEQKKIDAVHNGKVLLEREGYIGAKNLAWLLCRECGFRWRTKPETVVNNKSGCPNCAPNAPVTPDEAERRIYEKSKGTVVMKNKSDFHGTKHPLIAKCLVCGYEWETRPEYLFASGCCPKCYTSRLEKPIFDLLTKKKCNFKYNQPLKGCRMEGSDKDLRPDFLFDNYPLVFELDGQQHLISMMNDKMDFEKIQQRDFFKNNYLKKNGFILIRAVFDETIELATNKHIILNKLIDLINMGISDEGEVNLDVFKPYDFNRE